MSNIQAGEILKQINDELARRANESLKADELTFSQVGIVLRLRESADEGMSIKELSSSVHVAQPTMTGIVDRLERKGIVCSCSDAEDRRIRRVYLTEKGENCLANAGKNRESTEALLLAGMTDEEVDQFKTLLLKVRGNLLD